MNTPAFHTVIFRCLFESIHKVFWRWLRPSKPEAETKFEFIYPCFWRWLGCFSTQRHLLLVGLLCCFIGGLTPAWASPAGPQLFLAGRKALEQGKYQQALQLLRQAVEKLPHWGHIHLELAQALQLTGAEPSVTARVLEQAQRLLPPSNPRVYLVAGLFWEGQGDTNKALELYREAIRLGHFSPQPCLRAARIWLSWRQAQQAIPCLLVLLQRQQQVSETHPLLARAYTQTNQLLAAQKHWILALSYHPNSLRVLQQVYLFYARFTPTRPPRERSSWKRTLSHLETRLKRLLPHNKPRQMRMLLPSRR